MAKADQVVNEISEALREVDTQLRHHPYPDALERGEVTVEALRAFPGTQYHVATSDLRSMAMMVQRFGHTPARDFLNGILQGEFAALEGLRVLARRLGMTQEDLERYEVSPEGFAYATNMAWMAANVSAAEFAVGILVNFPAWGHTCGRMSRALRGRYGFTEQETVFLDAFAHMPPLNGTALPIIQEGLDQGVEPRLLHRSARFFQAYEKMFWDSMMASLPAPRGLKPHSETLSP